MGDTDERIVVAGGGTGGHVYPALAVAQALRQQAGSEGAPELLYVGVRGRLDEEIVAPSGLQAKSVMGICSLLSVSSAWAATASHTMTIPAASPETICDPSGLNATAFTDAS